MLKKVAVILFMLTGKLMVRLLTFNQINELGRILGMAYYLVSPVRKKRMLSELKNIFPEFSEKDVKKIILMFFQNYVLNKLEVFSYPLLNKDNIQDITEVEGLRHLDDTLKLGRGAVLIHAHLGNAQMLMPALGYRGYKVNQVGFSPQNIVEGVCAITGRRQIPFTFNYWMYVQEKCEQSLPANFIYLRKDSLREAYNSLKKNEIIAISVDGVPGGKYIWDFLGKKTNHFMDGPVRIALKSGASLLPIFVVRHKNGRQRITIEKPIKIELLQDMEETIRHNVQKFLHILEGYVRQYPWLYAKFFGYHKEKQFFISGEDNS